MNLVFLFVYLSALLILFYLTYQKTKVNKAEDDEREVYVDMDHLDTISEMKDNIILLSDMIADIRACEPGSLVRTVKVTIPEYNRSYEFMADGVNEISDILVDLIDCERDSIYTSLRSEIEKIK